MKQHLKTICVLVAMHLAGCGDDHRSDNADSFDSPSLPAFDWQGVVRHVVDGDSLYIEGVEPQIRLWAVDAPERDERGYDAAKKKLINLAKGKVIGCETKDIDKYDRIVGRCFVLSGGLEINRELIASGVSNEYCRFSKNHYGTCD